MTLKTERRTQLRKRPLSLVYVELPPSNGGMMRDLSEHGFSLRAMMPLRPSEKIPFSFALDTSARIDGEAIVLRLDDGGHVAALEFAGLPTHSRDQIRRWLDKFDEPISPESSPVQAKASKHASLTELRTQIRPPKPPSPTPRVAESAPPAPAPPKMTEPPPTEQAPTPPSPVAEIAPSPPIVAAPTMPDPPPVQVSATVVTSPPPPPVVIAPPNPEPPLPLLVESPQQPPRQPAMAIPRPSSPPLKEAPPSPPPTFRPTFEQLETSPLPPLLKLSSVRPGPPPPEILPEPVVPATISKPVAEPPARIQISLPKPEPPAATDSRIPEPLPARPVAPRRVPPPALEPLSSFEAETDSDTPGWMDRFTFGRAVGIMLLLTLIAGSYVYHRELGQALIWLGHEIAGEDSPENSKADRPVTPSVAHAIPDSSPSARAIPPPPLTIQQPTPSIEPRGENLPPASDKTPSPQLKGATPGSLLPLTQVTRPPAPAPSADNSGETGQQEYLQALKILRAPGRATELPAAIRLLWVAVEKGNTSAEIELAELFRQGRGVAKNCAQTRILLSAAARRGNAEARKRLEAFQREGCAE
ncbi:MAG TPA: PilZ domain-containing protein [Candidatus Acidoferrum sp.]|nr:PilZ domain-containing protein [Candidatus Acidoferrum sp.]